MAANQCKVRRRMVKVGMDRWTRAPLLVDMIEVEHKDSGDVLARCAIGDDEAVERIADLLSTKRQPEAAMQVRQIAQDARKPVMMARNG